MHVASDHLQIARNRTHDGSYTFELPYLSSMDLKEVPVPVLLVHSHGVVGRHTKRI